MPSSVFLFYSIFFLFFSTSHTLFSHCHLPLTCLILSFSALSLKCRAFCPLDFFFLPLCFHLSFSWVHFYLYANNVPVLRKEAAYLFTSGLKTCMHAYTCTHTQYSCACRSVHPFLSYSETSHLLILLSFVSFLHFVFLLLCSFMYSVFSYFSLIVHDLMHVYFYVPQKSGTVGALNLRERRKVCAGCQHSLQTCKRHVTFRLDQNSA